MAEVFFLVKQYIKISTWVDIVKFGLTNNSISINNNK